MKKQKETTMTDLRTRCLALAEELSDNGICWADEDDINGILSDLTEYNLIDRAEHVAALANWFN